MKTVDMLNGYRADECIALKVSDNGFAPNIMPNDVVIIHRFVDIEDGDLAVCTIDSDTNAILRRVHKNKDGFTLVTDFSSIDKFPPIIISNEQRYRVHYFGKVVSLVRNLEKPIDADEECEDSEEGLSMESEE